jgi:hypothetical protein
MFNIFNYRGLTIFDSITFVQYGGYENIGMFTNEEGETDFEGAYDYANGLSDEIPNYEEQEEERYAEEEQEDTPDQEDTNEDQKDE